MAAQLAVGVAAGLVFAVAEAGPIFRGYGTESRIVCQLLESVGGGLYPVYPHDGD